jgi:hypothetical protein
MRIRHFAALLLLVALPVGVAAQERERDEEWRGAPVVRGNGIRTIEFAPTDVDRAGERIRVEMRGRPNGQAWFGIQNVTRDQPMTEVRSGLYEGSYTVRGGDAVNDGAVVVRLEWRGRTWQATAPRRIDIRTAGAPSSGFGDRDRIDRIDISPTTVDRPGVRIVVTMTGREDGNAWFGIQNVTRDQPMTEIRRRVYQGSYVVRAGDNVRNGAVVVRLERGGRAWQETAEERVTIVTRGFPSGGGADTGQIRGIEVFPRYIDRPGTRIAVRMEGRAGGRAWFGIESITRDQPMTEIRRGTYEGFYTARRGDNVRDARVVVRLEVDGRSWQETADRTVTIQTTGTGAGVAPGRTDAGVPSGTSGHVGLSQPRSGQVVTNPFRVEGQTDPGATVRIEYTYPAGTASSVREETGSVEARADANGRYGMTLSLPTPLPANTVRMRVFRVDEQGRIGPVFAVTFVVRRP